jgi:hypothetical protein
MNECSYAREAVKKEEKTTASPLPNSFSCTVLYWSESASRWAQLSGVIVFISLPRPTGTTTIASSAAANSSFYSL